jgi:TonB family protein
VHPPEALDSGVEGSVTVMFTVLEDGSVSYVSIGGSELGYGMDQEAIRVVKSTSGLWTAAQLGSNPTKMRFRIPIKFEKSFKYETTKAEEQIKLISENKIYESYEVSEKAEFPGGDEGLQRFIGKHVSYPVQALEQSAQGVISVLFVVNLAGSISDLSILGEKQNIYLENESIRVIKMTSGSWKPALLKGKQVRVCYRIPVKFQLF